MKLEIKDTKLSEVDRLMLLYDIEIALEDMGYICKAKKMKYKSNPELDYYFVNASIEKEEGNRVYQNSFNVRVENNFSIVMFFCDVVYDGRNNHIQKCFSLEELQNADFEFVVDKVNDDFYRWKQEIKK